MKKIIIALFVLIVIVVAVVGGLGWYGLSNAGTIIKAQLQTQGTKYLGTTVTLDNADFSLAEARLTLNGLTVDNPPGYSANNAMSIASLNLDLGGATSEPYVVQQFAVVAPAVLYESDASGGGNLLVIKDNLQQHLPTSEQPVEPKSGSAPLVIIEDVTVQATALSLDFSELPVEQLGISETTYSITLPTFSVGSIGKPNGIPADQVGAAVANAMLDEVIKVAKREAKEKAKERINQEIDKKKDELEEKAKKKLLDLLGE